MKNYGEQIQEKTSLYLNARNTMKNYGEQI